VILAHPLADLSLRHLNSAEIARYRDDRLEKVTGASVRRELAILRHCLETARRDWKIPLRTNPVQEVRVPAPPQARERRLQDTEATKLFQAIRPTSAAYLRPMIQLALETGMRRGELLALRWSDVELATRTVLIRHSKNGHSRRIPLTPGAMNILASLDRHEGTVFNVSANAFRLAWERLKRRAGIEGLRFHDLRHEAVSRFFELGLNVPEVAMISGHRDARMLFRYTHPRPELVADKLASAHATRPTAVTGAHTIAPE
jgi:integrase